MGDAMLAFLRRLRARIRYRRFDADLKEELRVHRAMAEDAWRESGRDPADVRHLAARDLGNTTLAREHVRGVWLAPGLESVWQDVVYAIRALRRSPGFTLPVLAVLVITMGMTTSLYATVRTVLFRPWPVDDAAHVVDVRTRRDVMTQTGRITLFGVPPVEYRYLRDHTRSLDLVALGLEYQKPDRIRSRSGCASSAATRSACFAFQWRSDAAWTTPTIVPATRRPSSSSATRCGGTGSRDRPRRSDRRCASAACRSRSSASRIAASRT
jgi:hypothetical protein